MTGKELFTHYTSLRDHSGSADDEYAQLLMTLFHQLGDDVFTWLERAEKEGKRLIVPSVEFEEISPEDILME